MLDKDKVLFREGVKPITTLTDLKNVLERHTYDTLKNTNSLIDISTDKDDVFVLILDVNDKELFNKPFLTTSRLDTVYAKSEGKLYVFDKKSKEIMMIYNKTIKTIKTTKKSNALKSDEIGTKILTGICVIFGLGILVVVFAVFGKNTENTENDDKAHSYLLKFDEKIKSFFEWFGR